MLVLASRPCPDSIWSSIAERAHMRKIIALTLSRLFKAPSALHRFSVGWVSLQFAQLAAVVILGALPLELASCDTGLGSTSTPPPPSTPPPECHGSVSMPYYAQQTNVWCWAAAAQMVIGAYTAAPDQCQVASVA